MGIASDRDILKNKKKHKERLKKRMVLYFCPACGGLLSVEPGSAIQRLQCKTCPYVHNILEPLRQKKYPRLKELRDVMGGEAAWENADSMEEQCTKDGCDNRRAYFYQLQTRSADEPM